MDTFRGNFSSADYDADDRDFDDGEDETGRELPPAAIGTDERRMQVRAYNHWASLLEDRSFPSIEDLEPETINDFGPFSVLLDFTSGIEDPAIQYLGTELAGECGTHDEIERLSDVPSRSLLSRITDHYMQILANQAPIGFEAEFVNQRGMTILYRGILLPYSSDGETIDFIYGVINWKEMADQITTDELLLEIDQALDGGEPVADGSDLDTGAIGDPINAPLDLENELGTVEGSGMLDLGEFETSGPDGEEEEGFPAPAFGADKADYPDYAAEISANDDLEDADEAAVQRLSSLIQPRERKQNPLAGSFGDDDWEDADDGDQFHDPLAAMRADDQLSGGADYGGVDYGSEDSSEDGVAPLGASPLLKKKTKTLGHGLGSMFETSENNFGDDFDEEDIEETEDFETANDLGIGSDREASLTDIPAGYGEDETPDVPVTGIDEQVPAAETALLGASDASQGDLYDCLAEARELAQIANTSEDRTRTALYDAVGRAYDVSLAAQESPEDFAELIEENGLTVQERAPMTPVVKLVFGADYDKTRLTEYAAVLQHAQRLEIGRGGLSRFLSEAEGGLKAVVQAERRIRKEESGKTVDPVDEIRPALAEKLRELEYRPLSEISADGAEFGAILIRRLDSGEIVFVAEVSGDIPLLEKVARKVAG